MRINEWGKVPAEFAAFDGEMGRRGAFVPEYYLDERSEPVGRRLKLMCRLGCLPRMSRVSREEKLHPSQDKCKLCEGEEREDLQHLLLACPTHSRARARMDEVVTKALSERCELEFHTMCPDDQVDMLLGKSTGNVHVDDRIDQVVTRFLKKAWRTRKWLTTSINDKLGRQDTVWALRAHGDGQHKDFNVVGKGRGSKKNSLRAARAC